MKPKDMHDYPQRLVRQILEFLGEDPDRPGLKDTPNRVVRSWMELYAGHGGSPASLFTEFEESVSSQLVLVRNIEFYSMCEHHMLPFTGMAHVGYIPKMVDGKTRLVGLSKLARLVDLYARRLQVQERIAHQVVEAMWEHMELEGAACIIEAKHLCMACRGVAKQNSIADTICLKGVFLEESTGGIAARAELMGRINKG